MLSFRAMKTNYHTHTTWCDGADGAETMVLAAIEKGFAELGFSSHAMFPEAELGWTLTEAKIVPYFREIRGLARRHAGEIGILCGVEADYVPGPAAGGGAASGGAGAAPDRAVYARFAPDYVIGSVHFVTAPDGFRIPVDMSPDSLFCGIIDHFGGDAEAFVKEYFRLEREMAAKFDFDLVGHPDLVRKFNAKHPWLDENAPWYLDELERTADALAASGKPVEVNTGAISRGWMDDVYPSRRFRDALRSRGVRFVLSSDAHSAHALDCAFDRFGGCEDFVRPPWSAL